MVDLGEGDRKIETKRKKHVKCRGLKESNYGNW